MDGQPLGLVCSKSVISLKNGLSFDSYTIRLSSAPIDDAIVTVSIRLNAAHQKIIELSTSELAFDASNWNQLQHVRVSTVPMPALDIVDLRGSHQSDDLQTDDGDGKDAHENLTQSVRKSRDVVHIRHYLRSLDKRCENSGVFMLRVDISKAKSGYIWTVGDGQFGCLGHGRCGSGMMIFTPVPLSLERPESTETNDNVEFSRISEPQSTLLSSLKRNGAIISDRRVKTALDAASSRKRSDTGAAIAALKDRSRRADLFEKKEIASLESLAERKDTFPGVDVATQRGDAIFSSVSCGRHHSMALTEEGEVFVFGSNEKGQLGCEGQVSAHKSPHLLSRIALLDSNRVKQIACGEFHSAFILSSGELATFGGNQNGQLGLRHTKTEYQPKIVVIRNSLEGGHSGSDCGDSGERKEDIVFFKQVSCGGSHTLALSETGVLYSTGNDNGGQLGHGKNRDGYRNNNMRYSTTFKMVAFETLQKEPAVEKISAGQNHSGCILDDGTVWMWGTANNGRLGLGRKVVEDSANAINSPLIISSLVEKGISAQGLECGGSHTAIVSFGKLFTFGDGSFGQLGHGDLKDVCSPKVVEGLEVTRVAVGFQHTAIIDSSGRMQCCGNGMNGALGFAIPNKSIQSHFKVCKSINGLNPILVSCGWSHTMILCANKEVVKCERSRSSFRSRTKYQPRIEDPEQKNLLAENKKGKGSGKGLKSRLQRKRRGMNRNESPEKLSNIERCEGIDAADLVSTEEGANVIGEKQFAPQPPNCGTESKCRIERPASAPTRPCRVAKSQLTHKSNHMASRKRHRNRPVSARLGNIRSEKLQGQCPFNRQRQEEYPAVNISRRRPSRPQSTHGRAASCRWIQERMASSPRPQIPAWGETNNRDTRDTSNDNLNRNHTSPKIYAIQRIQAAIRGWVTRSKLRLEWNLGPTGTLYINTTEKTAQHFKIGTLVKAYNKEARKRLPGRLIWLDPTMKKCKVSFANGSMDSNILLEHVEVADGVKSHDILRGWSTSKFPPNRIHQKVCREKGDTPEGGEGTFRKNNDPSKLILCRSSLPYPMGLAERHSISARSKTIDLGERKREPKSDPLASPAQSSRASKKGSGRGPSRSLTAVQRADRKGAKRFVMYTPRNKKMGRPD